MNGIFYVEMCVFYFVVFTQCVANDKINRNVYLVLPDLKLNSEHIKYKQLI